MKRILSVFLAVILLLSFSTAALAADGAPTISVQTSASSVVSGQDVTVTISMDKTMTGVVSFEYRLVFDSNLFTLKSSQNGTAHSAMLISNLKTKNGITYYSINYVDPTSEGQTIAAGTVYTLVFTAKTVSTDTSASFSLSRKLGSEGAYDSSFKQISDALGDPASVTVTPVPATNTVAYDVNGGTGTMTDSHSPYADGVTATVLVPAAGA